MTEKQKEVISLYVQEIVKDNSALIEDYLLNGVTNDMDKDNIVVKMVLNSVTLSTTLATQIVLDILENSKVISPKSDEYLKKVEFEIRTKLADL